MKAEFKKFIVTLLPSTKSRLKNVSRNGKLTLLKKIRNMAKTSVTMTRNSSA